MAGCLIRLSLFLLVITHSVFSATSQVDESPDSSMEDHVQNLTSQHQHIASEMLKQAETDAGLISNVTELHSELKRQKKEDDRLEKRIDSATSDKRRAWKNLSQKEKTDAKIRSDYENTNSMMNDQQEEVSELASNFRQLFASLPYECRAYSRLKNKLNELKKENEQQKQRNEKLRMRNEKLRSQTQSLTKETDEVENRVEEMISKKEKLKLQLELCPEAEALPRNCLDLLRANDTESGVKTVYVGSTPVDVYCDQDCKAADFWDGPDGGWLVIQRRFNGSVDFFRPWKDYVEGFGDLNGEFWLGLRKIHQLTTNGVYSLRIDLTDSEPWTNRYWPLAACYQNFYLAGEEDNYRLHLKHYYGQAVDNLWDNEPSESDGYEFSTYDNDNDDLGHVNCAMRTKSGWWDGGCVEGNLNVPYYDDDADDDDDDDADDDAKKLGITWRSTDGYRRCKATEMKIRPLLRFQ